MTHQKIPPVRGAWRLVFFVTERRSSEVRESAALYVGASRELAAGAPTGRAEGLHAANSPGARKSHSVSCLSGKGRPVVAWPLSLIHRYATNVRKSVSFSSAT